MKIFPSWIACVKNIISMGPLIKMLQALDWVVEILRAIFIILENKNTKYLQCPPNVCSLCLICSVLGDRCCSEDYWHHGWSVLNFSSHILSLHIVMFLLSHCSHTSWATYAFICPQFSTSKMGADGLPLALQGSVNINEEMGMFHNLSSCQKRNCRQEETVRDAK